MWRDVVIGSGDPGYSARSTPILNILENSTSYWISHVYLDLGMTIFKYTKEGKKLSQMIVNKSSLEIIDLWLKHQLLKHIDSDDLIKAIDCNIENARKDGASERAAQIRELLEI